MMPRILIRLIVICLWIGMNLFGFTESGCARRSFGRNCSFTCHCTEGTDCDSISGICFTSLCQPGWAARNCSVYVGVGDKGVPEAYVIVMMIAVAVYTFGSIGLIIITSRKPVKRVRIRYKLRTRKESREIIRQKSLEYQRTSYQSIQEDVKDNNLMTSQQRAPAKSIMAKDSNFYHENGRQNKYGTSKLILLDKNFNAERPKQEGGLEGNQDTESANVIVKHISPQELH